MNNNQNFSTRMHKKEESDAKFLESLKEELKDRYSEKDTEFVKYMNEPNPSPPILLLNRKRQQSNYRAYHQNSRQQYYSQDHREQNRNRTQSHRDQPDRSGFNRNRYDPYARKK
jgi:hypothetical protein